LYISEKFLYSIVPNSCNSGYYEGLTRGRIDGFCITSRLHWHNLALREEFVECDCLDEGEMVIKSASIFITKLINI
jgi:hypothetical protein